MEHACVNWLPVFPGRRPTTPVRQGRKAGKGAGNTLMFDLG